MPARVLDSSDEQRTLVLVVALRVLRDPVLALDAANEAAAGLPAGADDETALGHLWRVVDTARREGRVGSVERRRHRTGLEVVEVGPALRAELHALGACRLARDDEPLALAENVVRVAARLERDAPTIQQIATISSSGLVVAPRIEAGDRPGD